ncbi:serine hydrolase [Mycolicibacterium sp. S2-37]|uniref:serine hydrolase n=1 Tax=Mycolicibacterium sp. S2-37 TaxID=2810297 RepID=UPI0024159E26|nr:serine hydrolase [Mycolicibacterium sp. S2-37]
MIKFYKRFQRAAVPGAIRQYSNPSIGLLGHVAAIALRSEFTELLQGELMPRLGLSSSFVEEPEEMMDDYAWGYDRHDEPVRVKPGVFDAEAYGVKSTTADMLRFVERNITPTELDPQMRQAVSATQVGYVEVGPMVQGLGLGTVSLSGVLGSIAGRQFNRDGDEPPEGGTGQSAARRTQVVQQDGIDRRLRFLCRVRT